jgi:hypothetical protein
VAVPTVTYERRRPEETTLYQVVQDNLETLYGAVDDGAVKVALPEFVRTELGFVHVRCATCEHHLAVAFSCKTRTLCPSCSGRRMAGCAAHLVDRVLPSVPVRQYVLAFPYELSGLAATRPDVLSLLSRVFWEALRLRYRRWAKQAGLGNLETGAVTGVQRFGSSLNVHVHFHLLCLDGVYVEDGGALRFEPAPPPTRSELESMLQSIYARVMKWLGKRGLLREDEGSNARAELSPTEALTTLGMERGTLVSMREGADGAGDDAALGRPAPPPRATEAVVHERFNLHASVRLGAQDDVGRERLCRFLTRPAFALGRIRLLRDGNVAYRVKKVSVASGIQACVVCRRFR